MYNKVPTDALESLLMQQSRDTRGGSIDAKAELVSTVLRRCSRFRHRIVGVEIGRWRESETVDGQTEKVK